MNPNNQKTGHYVSITLIIFILIIIVGFAASKPAATTELVQQDNFEKAATQTNKVENKPATDSEAGVYKAYSASAVANSNAENIVLFFYATWCPSCRALDAEISSHLSSIPVGTEIYKVDYDTATELKKRYGVTTQHTLVQIKNDGTMVNKWSGGDLKHLLTSLK
ncbi:MAG: thioredoxin family protein [Candidatus Nomurabacteria bacterium]|nr:thioredoxin family protein [Candidatus Nomurabacteria bacterium]USN87336.1 MAG: thioredoxin family protein [Candidatus Nomurabacteria bacterium]